MTKITTALTYEGIAGPGVMGPDRIAEFVAAKAGNGPSDNLAKCKGSACRGTGEEITGNR